MKNSCNKDQHADEQTDDTHDVSRRTFLQASGVTGLMALGVGAGATTAAAANAATDEEFLNWRVREAMHAWNRGYRGRPDRAIGLTDSGIEARHPDLGPWNGVRAVKKNGELLLTRPDENDLTRTETGDTEQFSGTIGPGTLLNPETKRHKFTVPDGVDELDAALSWTPADEDLEFYVEDADGNVVASKATANNPETLTADVVPGATYYFVVETWLNVIAEYEITGSYYEISGTFTTYDSSVVFEDVTGKTTSDTPKVVGWYDEGDRYGRYDAPRDGNGHGTHVSSIMGGTGRASAVDATTVTEDAPRTELALGDVLTYEVTARSDTGVYASAYGDGIELVIEGPNGEELDASVIGVGDTSEHDNNIAQAPTVHDSGEATYAVHVRPYDGELVSAARVETVSVGAFLKEDETVGDRTTDGDRALHSGLAANASLVGLQGLSEPTHDLARFANEFSSIFNLRTVNMSWGYVGGLPLGAAGGALGNIVGAVKDIAEGGILTVAAAGNSATPANGNGAPGVADEAISVAATGPLDGLTSYSSGGLGALDEDNQRVYMKPDVTAPGGSLTDLANAARNGDPDAPEDEQPAIRDYTLKAGTSMASPYVNGIAGLVSEAMEFDAPDSIALPEPAQTDYDDVMRLKQAILATASESAFTAAPYHRAHAPTYEFGGRDPYEGFGRVNPGAAVDAVTRELSGTSTETVGLNVPETERAVAGYVQAGPGTVDVSVAFSHLHGANAGAAKDNPHIDLFVYDAENPAADGNPNVVGRAQGLSGDASVTVSVGKDAGVRTFYVVAKLVNVPGVVNGYDVRATFDLSVETAENFFVDGTREDDASAFTGGQTNQVDVTVDPSENAHVRDAVPAEWTVLTEYSDDVDRVEEDADAGVKHVYFAKTAKADNKTGYTYFAEAPDELELSRDYTFGPVEVEPTSRDGWVSVSGTSDVNVVVGQHTSV